MYFVSLLLSLRRSMPSVWWRSRSRWMKARWVWQTVQMKSNTRRWYRFWEQWMESMLWVWWCSPCASVSSLETWKSRVDRCETSSTVWMKPLWDWWPLSCGEWFTVRNVSALTSKLMKRLLYIRKTSPSFGILSRMINKRWKDGSQWNLTQWLE